MPRSDATATYAYCVVRATRVAVAKAPRGLAGAGKARVLDAGRGVWIVVCDAPLELYGEEAIERGLHDIDWVAARGAAHETVVEHFARAGTVVPLKLFTLFDDDASALAHFAKLRAKLDRAFSRVEGCEEWGVRVHVDPSRAPTTKRAPAKSGAGFLRAKKEQHDAAKTLVARGRDDAQVLLAKLSSQARESIERPPAHAEVAKRVVLDAVFLVPARASAKFRASVAREAKKLASGGLGVALTGPWPAYHFVGGRG